MCTVTNVEIKLHDRKIVLTTQEARMLLNSLKDLFGDHLAPSAPYINRPKDWWEHNRIWCKVGDAACLTA